MNQQIAITMPGQAASTVGWTDETMLDRIVSRLRAAAASISATFRALPQHRSFIEENLLDPRLGPEISRALR